MPLFSLLFTYGNMITQISKVSKHFMIFDVALITEEAEQDFRMWHLDIERFKLPAQGWTESLWQPREPEVVLLKPKRCKNNQTCLICNFCRNRIMLQPLTVFCREITTHLESVFELIEKLRKQRLTLFVMWAKMSCFRNLLRKKTGFGSVPDQMVWKKYPMSKYPGLKAVRSLFNTVHFHQTLCFSCTQFLFLSSKLQPGVITKH